MTFWCATFFATRVRGRIPVRASAANYIQYLYYMFDDGSKATSFSTLQTADCDIGSDHHDHLGELGAYRSSIHAALSSIQLSHKTRYQRESPFELHHIQPHWVGH